MPQQCGRALSLASLIALTFLVPQAFAKPKDKHLLPPRDTSGVDHIIVVMMENRSFDHLFGWHPTADALNQELSYPDPDNGGVIVPTQQLSALVPPDYTGCGHPDPDHSWEGGRAQLNGGAMNGFLAGTNDAYAVGYYAESDRPFHSALATEFTTFDRFFSSILGETFANRIFLHAAQTDRLENSLDLSTLPTIWDRLIEKGVSARYYFSDASFLWLWGSKYLPISRPYQQFLDDAAAGTLPSVAFVDPRFIDERTGLSGDDHPFADIRVGDAFLAEIYEAVSSGPNWESTVLIVTYDEWGGFFDHVAPPRATAPNNVDPDLENGKALLGFRIPVVVASPFTRGDPASPNVNSEVFDNTSILKLIEWRWNLKPLTARDASSDVGNLAFALDLAHPDPTAPVLPLPEEPDVVPCLTAPPELHVGLSDLIELLPFGVAAPPPESRDRDPDIGLRGGVGCRLGGRCPMNVAEIRARIDHPIIDSDGHLIEYLPVVRDILREQAGEDAVKGYDFVTSAGRFMRTLTPEQMRAQAFTRSPWWGLPARNSLDRGTALLPALLAERLDEIGIDHAVLYPTYGLVPPNLDDADLRRAASRAFNTFYAEEFRDHRAKLTPVGIIPMHTPEEALAEIEHATGVLGLDAFMFGGPVLRPTPGVEHRAGRWLDTLGVDSLYDYDPVWKRCAELDIAPTFHTPSMGWATHSSPTNYVYNHIGMFAAGGEAVARSLFLGGVPHRFPTLRFAFLEGGVAWGASLYAGIVGHYEKRNREAVEHYNPKHLDRKLLVELFGKYGSDRYRARVGQLEEGLQFLSDPDETNLDEFAQSGVKSPDDIKAMFTERFYFGCEADDPLTAVAFDTDRNPLGARLKPIFASDIGHWDVPDIRDVLPEAWELVEDGHIDEAEFRAFTCDNARALWPQLRSRLD